MMDRTISHYQILEKLGEGGMGVVYRARDTKLDRDVALKFLPAHVSATSEMTARFLQEARAAAALNHANICTIYGVEEHEEPGGSKQMFIAMEYIDGGTLRGRIPLAGIAETVSIAVQTGEALQEAHSKGIVHRDIKADNIMLTSKGQVKVMDFGLAKLRGSLKLTKTSSTVGTLGYMAPEQIGGGEVDARSDIFSFGVLIYEMLTGRLPFRGEHEAAMVYSIMNEDPEPLAKYLPDAPPELVLLLSKALEKDPADRYQSVGEMLVDLRRLKKSTGRVSRQYPARPSGGENVTAGGSGAGGGGAAAREGEAVPNEGGAAASGTRRGGPVTGPEAAPARKKPLMKILSAAVILVAAAAAVLFLLPRKAEKILPSAANMKMTRFTSSGDAGYATISPDGKYVVYVKGQPGQFGLWIRQVATGSEVVVIPPSDVQLFGSTFSNDGNYVYYTASLPEAPVRTVYRIPVLGGIPPRKIIENADSPVTLSPDDKEMAFLRADNMTGEEAIFVANADGSGERKLASRDGKNLFFIDEGATPAWSPDGRLIVCSAGSTVGGFSMYLVSIPVSAPKERILTTAPWTSVGRAAWYPDGSGLIACTAPEGEPSQLTYVSYPEGNVTRITNDLLVYGPSSLSITKDASTIVSAQSQRISTLTVVPGGNSALAREITRGSAREEGSRGIAWIGNAAIAYTSKEGNVNNIWVTGADGTGARQITFNVKSAYDMSISREGRVLYYTSSDDTLPCTWRISAAGGGQPARVTGGEDYNPEVSPDGAWLLFDSWRSGARSIWAVPIDRPDSARLFRAGATMPAFSPDGRLVACRAHDPAAQRMRMTILEFPSGAVKTVFDFPATAGDSPDFRWAPDGRTIHFVDSPGGVGNVYSYDPGNGAVRKLTGFTSGRIFNFAWSPDGKNLAVARGQVTSDIVLLSISQ